jgi:hypothetical protein
MGLLGLVAEPQPPWDSPAPCLGGPLDGETRRPYSNGDLVGRSSDWWLWRGSPDPNERAKADYFEGDYRQVHDPAIWPWHVEWRWTPDTGCVGGVRSL